MATAVDSKSTVERLVGSSPTFGTMFTPNTAYVVGVAIGDGNLSNPNGRATRLRITCDNKYPLLIERIKESLKLEFPDNKVSTVHRKQNCIDISCYSNKLENILGWKAKSGSKYNQKITVPKWVKTDKIYIKNCLKGLFETDGSIYKDRNYVYINFTTIISSLACDVEYMLTVISYEYTTQKVTESGKKPKYVIRICRRFEEFIKELNLSKS